MNRDSDEVESGVAHDNVLRKVRALLAKAESTNFGEEAESLNAKAQELMARYAIDVAMLDAKSGSSSSAIRVEIIIENPYWSAKASLLSRIAEANRCRSIWDTSRRIVTVFGFEVDIEHVDVLFTSLLVQASAALARHGSVRDTFGSSRTRSFRKSFLEGFAIRIGERLREASESAMQDEHQVRGESLLPVFVARKAEVDRAVEVAFPYLGAVSRSIGTNFAGYSAGRAAADSARLAPQARIGA